VFFVVFRVIVIDHYRYRHALKALLSRLEQFPVVLVLGARQVGKTTFLGRELPDWGQIDLEVASLREVVSADPDLFLGGHPDKVWFDEAQRCPELFSALRVAVDRDRRPGRYILSGSASPALVKEVSESLAGRCGIIDLHGLSASEAISRPRSRFLDRLLASPTASELVAAISDAELVPREAILDSWFRGAFPEARAQADDDRRARWFDAYVRLVSERDLADLHRDLRPPTVHRLLRMLAVRQGQELNVAALARDHGVTARKVGLVLDILEGAYLWRRLPPFLSNTGKRLVRRPRGYVADSGLLHALLQILTPEQLELSPAVGPSWEGFLIGELLQQLSHLDLSPAPYFWSTHQGAEVDLVLETGSELRPVEIKHTSRLGPMPRRSMRIFLADFEDVAPFGVIVHRGEYLGVVDERVAAVPAALVL
jgi:uncharacterized protein